VTAPSLEECQKDAEQQDVFPSTAKKEVVICPAMIDAAMYGK